MQFTGALINEQNVTFAVVLVKPDVINNPYASNQARQGVAAIFPGVPIILMAQEYDGTPIYQGREDIASFLASIHHSRIPWKTYNYS